MLLAIGDEVLRGEIANSNSAFSRADCSSAGLELREHIVVSDDATAIRAALVRLRAEVDVVVASGGLGPTEDDRTVDVVADAARCRHGGRRAVAGRDEEALLDRTGFELTPNNLRQVRVPAGAEALPNAAGLAPGFAIALGGAQAFFLPGVPREMEKIFADHVAPRAERAA